MEHARKVIIIGSGPAGLTAAIYACRADLQPVVFMGTSYGGQLMLTTGVENYPGFVDPIMGPDLMESMKKQAERLGAEMLQEDVTEVDFRSYPFKVKTTERAIEALSVIIATGATPKRLGLESEMRLMGRGVSNCAVCDGFFFKGKDVVLVGGGDTAMEDSTFLTKFARSVTVVHRRDRLRASAAMQKRAFADPKIAFIWNSTVTEVLGSEKVSGVRIKNTATGEEKEMKADGLFVAIGYNPNTRLFEGQLEMDELGYIKAMNRTETSVPGVFVAGEAEDRRYRQAIAAAGDGCKALLDAERFLAGKHETPLQNH